jgi:hypothetical protein
MKELTHFFTVDNGLTDGFFGDSQKVFQGMVYTVRTSLVRDGFSESRKVGQKGGMYTAFSYAHQLGTPLIVNGMFELKESRMHQITKPPIGRMIHSDLSSQRQGTPTRMKHNCIHTLIVLVEFSELNNVHKCCTSSTQTSSSTKV